MTTTADIFTEIDQLIDSVTELLDSNTIESVVALIDMLGGGDIIHQLVVEFKGILTVIRAQIGQIITVIEEPLRHTQALSGLIGLLQPLIIGLRQLVDTSADEFADAGLDNIIQISEPISRAVGYGSLVLNVGASVLDILPSPEQLQELETSFELLIGVVEEYVEATA